MENAHEHHEPNYMNIFLALTVLTVIEVIIPSLGLLPKFQSAVVLVLLAVTKATLVALYFMHLRFEKKTLGAIALTPMIICVFLVFMLLPDITAENKLYESPDTPAVSETAP